MLQNLFGVCNVVVFLSPTMAAPSDFLYYEDYVQSCFEEILADLSKQGLVEIVDADPLRTEFVPALSASSKEEEQGRLRPSLIISATPMPPKFKSRFPRERMIKLIRENLLELMSPLVRLQVCAHKGETLPYRLAVDRKVYVQDVHFDEEKEVIKHELSVCCKELPLAHSHL